MALTLEQIRSRSSVSDINLMDDESLQNLYDRAVAFLRALTRRNFAMESDPAILADVDTMILLSIEYLFFHSQEDVKEDAFLGYSGERIGSYSYTKERSNDNNTSRDQIRNRTSTETALITGRTGNPEFDVLISMYSFRGGGAGPFFSVRAPSGKRGPRL